MLFVRCRQHRARPDAPTPHSRAFPPRPPALVLPLARRSPRRKARPSALATHIARARRYFRARRAPPPVRTCTRARTAQKIRPSPRRSFETACFRFFAKHFKLCGQLAEQGREGREGTAVPAAGGFILSELVKHFKLCRQLAERKREGREGTTFP